MQDGSKATTGFKSRLKRGSLGRRGMLTALTALVAATMGKVTEQTAEAGVDGDLVLGVTNNSNTQTTLNSSGARAFQAESFSANGVGLYGKGTVYGSFGEATTPGGFGIFGFSSGGYGIVAQSSNAVGLYAASNTNVGGYCISTSNFGMIGSSTSGIGAHGVSSSSIGVLARSATGPALRAFGPTELYGDVEIGDFEVQGSALYNLNITGDLKVNGQKSAIVRGADGDFRQFYCLESPENFFEDFGTAQLDRGKVSVKLDNEFKYFVAPKRGFYVFLTPLGDTPGLYVSNLADDGFDVHEVGNGQSNIQFQYRVVCVRKDVPGKRLERVDPRKREPGRRRVPRNEGNVPTPPPVPNVPRGSNIPQPPPPPNVPAP